MSFCRSSSRYFKLAVDILSTFPSWFCFLSMTFSIFVDYPMFKAELLVKKSYKVEETGSLDL